MTDHAYIALPPDGNGKKVPQSVMMEFDYDTGTTKMDVGDVLTFSTSTFTGVVIQGDSLSNGRLFMKIHIPVPMVPALVGGEDISVNAVKVAQVSSTPNDTPYYFQENVIVGGENMKHRLEIDRRGSAQVTFANGTHSFDAIGRLQVSQSKSLGEYIQSYDELPNKFTDTIVAGGSLTYDNSIRSCKLSNTTASEASYIRTSNQYHLYQAGVSTLIEMTCAVGDTGKADVNRFWGLFDDDNGMFFDLNGTAFGVTQRSKSTGSVVNTTIDQSDWNVDRLDGTGSVFNPSNFTLDVSKINLYWIDYQWLGAGTIRMGVKIDGELIICHQIHNANRNVLPYMSTGSLPIRYGQTNTAMSASTSEYTFTCATVLLEGEFSPARNRYTGDYSSSVTTTSDTVIAAGRPLQTYKMVDNRGEVSVDDMTIHNAGTDAIIVKLWVAGTITGGTWTSHSSDSIMEINETGSLSSALAVNSFMVKGGDVVTFAMIDEATIYRDADIASTPNFTITAALLSAGTGGIVTSAINWNEVLK